MEPIAKKYEKLIDALYDFCTEKNERLSQLVVTKAME